MYPSLKNTSAPQHDQGQYAPGPLTPPPSPQSPQSTPSSMSKAPHQSQAPARPRPQWQAPPPGHGPMEPTKREPTAPVLDADADVGSADKDESTISAVVAPEPLPPANSRFSKCRFVWMTFKLVPYHVLNFGLGTAGFVVAVTGVCVSLATLPLCGLGIAIYLLVLQLLRVLAVGDVLLANSITRSDARVRWDVPDDLEGAPSAGSYGLRLAPKLARISLRSTTAVLYFLTVKFCLGLISIGIVVLPLLPIASEMVADYASDAVNTRIAGFPVKKFNFGTNPVLYTLTCIGYFIVGIVLMHIFGRISRTATRAICCQKIRASSSNVV